MKLESGFYPREGRYAVKDIPTHVKKDHAPIKEDERKPLANKPKKMIPFIHAPHANGQHVRGAAKDVRLHFGSKLLDQELHDVKRTGQAIGSPELTAPEARRMKRFSFCASVFVIQSRPQPESISHILTVC